MNKLLLESSETILDELFWRKKQGEYISIPELQDYNRTPHSTLPEYETSVLIKQIKKRRPYYFITGLFITYAVISYIIWLITIIYLKLSSVSTAVSVRYSTANGWELSHSVFVSIIMVNVVLVVTLLFLGMNIFEIIKKVIRISIKCYYKYKEENKL